MGFGRPDGRSTEDRSSGGISRGPYRPLIKCLSLAADHREAAWHRLLAQPRAALEQARRSNALGQPLGGGELGFRPGPVAATTVGGALIGVVFARIVDELRWRRSAVCIELAEPDAVLDLLQAVRAEGMQADMIRADRAGDTGRAGYALRYRGRDDRRVRAVLAAQQS